MFAIYNVTYINDTRELRRYTITFDLRYSKRNESREWLDVVKTALERREKDEEIVRITYIGVGNVDMVESF